MSGRVWLFDDDIDTDVLAPGRYMNSPLKTLAAHCLEAVNPEFATAAKPGDVLVAGRNFGVGSSREQAAECLKVLGIAAVVAQSFAGIFYRNAINLGLPVLVGQADQSAKDGDAVSVDIRSAVLTLPSHTIQCELIPDFLLDLIAAGGLVPHLEKRFIGSGM
ncbi:MAG: 3-isopropylmalate dehydratase [Amylibacter sp.]|nr:3-isopropylmalate dehydratase [Amylibacter sp.]MDG1236457.1 3-isopropylmalate dehydratase [Amylibacter sp.]MDG1999517.1 3-isopropylmalate dehydratase [Amylibacter sp.]